MNKGYIKRYSRELIVLLLVFSTTIFTGCAQTNDNVYKENLTKAESLLDNDNFSEAKEKYKEILKDKNSDDIKAKIDLCDKLEKSATSFKQAETYINNKDYLNAYNAYLNVDSNDSKRYEKAKSQSEISKKSYVDFQMQSAQNYCNSSNYDQAIAQLDLALKLDQNNPKVLENKTQYTTLLNKQKEDQRKKDEELKAKAQAEANAKAKVEAEAKVKQQSANKESQNNSVTVYITETGKKYHTGGCRYLRKSKIATSLKNAKAGYDPCSVCNPPQ